MKDSDDFPCINEEYGLDCEYPFCNCESDYYDDKLQELPEIFAKEELPEGLQGEWAEDEDD